MDEQDKATARLTTRGLFDNEARASFREAGQRSRDVDNVSGKLRLL